MDQFKGAVADFKSQPAVNQNVWLDKRRCLWRGTAFERGTPQLERPAAKEWCQPVHVAQRFVEAGAANDLRPRFAEFRHAAIMIGVALGQDDVAHRPGAVRRKQGHIALGMVHEAGIDHYVAVIGGDEMGVRDIVGHEHERRDRHSLGLAIAGADQIGERGFRVRIAHTPVPGNSIITFAEVGWPAIFSPSRT